MSVLLVTSRSFSSGSLDLEHQANKEGYNVTRGPSHHSLDELRPLLADAVGWIAGTGPITAEHMDNAPKLRVIARYGVGTDMVDLEAARVRGIMVTNTPGANTQAVADLAVGLMIAALRQIVPAERSLRGGDWGVQRGRELGALSVGIVGFGRIGQNVAKRLSGFGCTLMAFDPYATGDAFGELTVERVGDLNDLLSRADVVTLHAPGGETLIDSVRLSLMKPQAVIINTSRADVVDEKAIAHALQTRQLGSYAADVLQGDTAALHSPLLGEEIRDYVTLTPHIAAQTTEAIDGMGHIALANALQVLAGKAPGNPVISLEKEN